MLYGSTERWGSRIAPPSPRMNPANVLVVLAPAPERREPRRGRAGAEELRPRAARRGRAARPGRARPRSGGPGTAREDVLARARRLARKAGDVLDAARGPRRPARGPARRQPGRAGRPRAHVEGRPRLDPAELGREVARRSAAGPVGDRVRAGAARPLGRGAGALPGGLRDPDRAGVRLHEPRPGGGGDRLGGRLARRRAARRLRRRRPSRRATRRSRRSGTARGRSSRRAGYLNPQNPEHILAELRRLLARAEPTQREAELCVAAVRALERVLRA